MPFIVEVDKKELARFRKIAVKQYKEEKEYMELLFVLPIIKIKHEKYIIKEFKQLDLEATKESVRFCNNKQFNQVYQEALDLGYELGSIHSHPDCEASPSIKDMESEVGSEFILSGICSLFPTKHKHVRAQFKFWKPQLPAEIYDPKDKSSTQKKSSIK